MKEVNQIFEQLLQRYPALQECRKEIFSAFEAIRHSYENGGKLLVCGNGGSASDAEHIAGELMKSFSKKRPLPQDIAAAISKYGERGKYLSQHLENPLTAIALTSHTSLNTAIANDIHADVIFAQQTLGYGKPGDVLLGISTSGNSKNVVYAAITAKALGMKTIALSGKNGGELKQICDINIVVPEKVTEFVQELHLPVYHALCAMLEHHFF